MIKRIVIFVFILSSLTLLAVAPLKVSAASENTPKLQTTVEVTIAVETAAPESTPGNIPVTGGGIPMATWIIFGLLAILGVAVVIGGMALVTRRQQ